MASSVVVPAQGTVDAEVITLATQAKTDLDALIAGKGVAAADALTAAGNSQATGLQLTAAVNNVTTCALGAGVNLPASAAGSRVVVMNHGANSLTVYPKQGDTDTVNGFTAAQGVELLPGSAATFVAAAAGAWSTMAPTATAAAFNTITSADADILMTSAQVSGGAYAVDAQLTAGVAYSGGHNLQLPTVASLVAVLHAPVAGASYRLRICNKQAGAFAATVTTNTGWTPAGTMTIAQNTWREFVVTLNTTSTATLQSVAVGTVS